MKHIIAKAAGFSAAMICAAALALMMVSVTPFETGAGEVDPKSPLKAMSDYLAAQQSISEGRARAALGDAATPAGNAADSRTPAGSLSRYAEACLHVP